MTIQTISPQEAKRLIDNGATLVDIREADEHARERIPGAVHAPLSGLDRTRLSQAGPAIFHCKSGQRTLANAGRLRAAAKDCEVWIVEGGLDAWKKAGMPVAQDSKQPIELMRQVQIVAGGIVAAGALAALLLSPWFALVPLFVGSGLVFAGATGTCGMAALLKQAPWNRRSFTTVAKN